MHQSHLNGNARRGSLDGVAGRSAILDGPGFSVEVRDSTFRVRGPAAPEQVLRLLAGSGMLKGAASDLRVRIVTSAGSDSYHFTSELRHRLLFRRAWDGAGRRAVFYGLNPIVGDTDGPVGRVPRRTTLRNVVAILSGDGPLGRLDVMNLFTHRSASAAQLAATASDRVAAPELERAVLAEADVVLVAWGSKVKDRHRPAVEDFLATLEGVGVRPSMLERDGQLLVVGSPPQPAHPSRLGHHGVRAVEVTAATVLGKGLPPSAPGPIQAERQVAGDAVPRPLQPTGPIDPPVVASVHADGEGSAERDGDVLTWASAHLDALGIEAVRRYLLGAVAVATEWDEGQPVLLRSPVEVAGRARDGGTAWDALCLAVIALRVTDGVAWWRPAARYVLADSTASRGRASGSWGKAARQAFEDAHGLERGSADQAASSGASHDLADTAARWGVDASETGTVHGPGAPKQFGADQVEPVGDGSPRPCYRRVR